jgi:hypothetical protein
MPLDHSIAIERGKIERWSKIENADERLRKGNRFERPRRPVERSEAERVAALRFLPRECVYGLQKPRKGHPIAAVLPDGSRFIFAVGESPENDRVIIASAREALRTGHVRANNKHLAALAGLVERYSATPEVIEFSVVL